MAEVLEQLSACCNNPIFITQLQEGLQTDGPWKKMNDEQAKINSYLRLQIGKRFNDEDGVREHLTETDHPVAWVNAINRYVIPLLSNEGRNG